MTIRIYIDEDAMSHALVNGLRARDVDVTTVLEQGMTGRDDLLQLEYASLQGRVFYTCNVGHFCHLHTQYVTEGKNHAGIIVVNRLRVFHWSTNTSFIKYEGKDHKDY